MGLGEKEAVVGPERWLSWDEAGSLAPERWKKRWRCSLGWRWGFVVSVTAGLAGRWRRFVCCRLRAVASRMPGNGKRRRAGIDGEDPNAVMQLARRLGGQFCWSGFKAHGVYEAIFNPRWASLEVM